MKLALFAVLGLSLIGAGVAQAHPGHARYNAAAHARGSVTPHYATAQNAPLAHGHSRAQTWYSDTGWQPGTSALSGHGHGYSYGSPGYAPAIIPHASYSHQVIYGPSTVVVQRSQPFGYVVDGYGRYPWSRQHGTAYAEPQAQMDAGHHGHHNCPHAHAQTQAHAQSYVAAPQPIYYQSAPVYVTQPPIHVQAPPVYIEPAQVHVSASPVHVAAPKVEVAPPQISYEHGYFAVPAETPQPPASTERPYRQEPGERG